jgi:hypothetical protein
MALALMMCAQANALDIVRDDHGGRIEPYAARVARAEARGERVRIGAVECDSSCTLFLAAPRSCVSANAVFGFHAPWVGQPTSGVVDPEMTAMFANSYKPALRRLFLTHVNNTADMVPGPLMRLSGVQLASLGYRLCSDPSGTRVASNRVRRNIRPAEVNPSSLAFWP